MKKIWIIVCVAFFYAFIPNIAHAAVNSIIGKVIIVSCPQLFSGSDQCVGELWAQTTDGSTTIFSTIYGIDFRTGTAPGTTTYLDNPSPNATGTITVEPVMTKIGTFSVQANNGSLTCALSESGVIARARIDAVCILCDQMETTTHPITNIGAVAVIHVNKADGSNASGARVSFLPTDYSVGTMTTNGAGDASWFQNLNCGIGHTVSASLGGEAGSIFLPGQTGSDSSTLCNGKTRSFTINMAPTTPPPSAPSGKDFVPSCGAGSQKDMTINFTPGSGATYNQVVYGVGCYTCSQQTVPVSPGQLIPNFGANLDIYYNVQSCNSGGCTLDPNGYSIINTGASCGAPASTPTPTPPPVAATCTGTGKTCSGSSTPVGSCTTSTGGTGTWSWDGQPSGTSCTVNPNTYCYNCIAAAATPIPTPTPTPVGGGGICTSGAQCFGVGACYESCCTCISPGFGDCSACPPPPPTPPPPFCGDGVCNGAETYITCPVDCPPPPPPPTYTITARVFVDNNQNGIYDTTSSQKWCKNSSWSNCKNSQPLLPMWVYVPGVTCQWWQFWCTPSPASWYYDANGNGVRNAGETQTSTTPLPANPTGYVAPPWLSRGGLYCIDTNLNGVCDVGETSQVAAPPDTSYVLTTIPADIPYNSQGIQIIALSRPGFGAETQATNAQGLASYPGNNGGSYPLTLTMPTGYTISPQGGALSKTATIGPDTTVDFPIISSVPTCTSFTSNPPSIASGATSTVTASGCTGGNPSPFTWPPVSPQCSDGIDNNGNGLIDANDPGCHSDGDVTNPSSYLPADDSEGTGSVTCNDGGVKNISSTSTSSTSTWNAPSCNTTTLICPVGITVTGSGGATSYSTNITVASSYTIAANVREVTSAGGACDPSVGTPYVNAVINFAGGSTNSNIRTNASGQAIQACLIANSYNVTIGSITGYSVVGKNPSGGGFGNVIATAVGPNQTVTFCILRTQPWYQTNFGDVRFRDVNNPIPVGNYGSTDTNYPGIYYSSTTTSNLGGGSVSPQGWIVNDEYSFNADTKNKNGMLSYSFYKSRARQQGITIKPLTPGIFTPSEITGSGIYEANGNLTINSYTHTSGDRVIILVNGITTITTPISVLSGQGLFIVASKGDLTFDRVVGTSTLNSTISSLDGYYTSEGNVVLDGINSCPTLDKRLNIAGVVIANAAKPFASDPIGGKIINNRSICTNSVTIPTLYVSTRTDFLTKLTDFYKTSYTKWTEVRP